MTKVISVVEIGRSFNKEKNYKDNKLKKTKYVVIKYVVRMMTNNDNVESSLQLLFIIHNLIYVQFLLQVAHL